MITVMPPITGVGAQDAHCVQYPSPSALEACAICNDKYRAEHATGGNGTNADSSTDADIGNTIHAACKIVLTEAINNDKYYRTLSVMDIAIYDAVRDDLYLLVDGWDDKYWTTVIASVKAVLIELYSMDDKHGNVSVWLEQRCELDDYLAGYYGTADVIAIAGHELLVADYKSGWRKVTARANRQLTCYAARWLTEYGIKTVTYYIVQVSKNNYDKWITTADDVKKLMQDNVDLINKVTDLSKEHSRCVSDMGCAYCRAKNNCSDYMHSIFSPAIAVLQRLEAGEKLTADDMAELYMIATSIETWKRNNKDSLFADVAAGKAHGYYIKRNKDKVSIDDSKKDALLAALKDDMQMLKNEGAIRDDVVIDVKKLESALGKEFCKIDKFLKRSPGAAKLIKKAGDNND